MPTPAAIDVLMLGPGERIDALVTMDRPGVWIMGAPENPVREGGLGIVIEYANQRGTPQWTPAKPCLGTTLGSARRRRSRRRRRDSTWFLKRYRGAPVNLTALQLTANRILTITSLCWNRVPVTG